MTDERLIVRMDGAPQDGGVPVRHFVSILTSALALLKQADCELAEQKGGKSKSEFFVVNASHNSPCMLEIACHAKDAVGNDVVSAVYAAFRSIKEGKADNLSARMMARIEKFIAPCKAKIRNGLHFLELDFVNVRDASSSVPIDSPFMKRVDQSRAREFECRTVVSGPAKMLDLRKEEDGEIRMKILRPIGGEVTCIMDRKLRERADEAMGQSAVMRGMGRYRPSSFHPYEIRVDKEEDIEIAPSGLDAPKLSELEGAFPGLTGGKPVEDYLREIRGEE